MCACVSVFLVFSTVFFFFLILVCLIFYFIFLYLAVVTYLFTNEGMEMVDGEVERIWDKLREGKP